MGNALDYKLFWTGADDSDLFWTGDDLDLFWGIALTLPASPNPARVEFWLESNTQTHISPLSKSVQTIALSGARWGATVTLPKMPRAVAAAWIAFLTELNGMAGRVLISPWILDTPRGGVPGTPLVSGASQTGRILKVNGWTASQTGILKAGDFIGWQSPTGWQELHMVTEDVDSNSSGVAYLSLTPEIRESPANNAVLITTDPKCVMQLADDNQSIWDIENASIFGLTFSTIEVFK